VSAKYSQILGYPVKVEEAQVGALIELLRVEGYNANKPMLLRPVGDRLQAVEGNHRFVAMWMLTKVLREFEQDYVPAIIDADLTEEDALIKLSTLNTQRRMEGWRLARLAYYTCIEAGMPQPDYAKKVGYNSSRISRFIQACKFVDYIAANSPNEELRDVEALTEPKNGLFRTTDRVVEFMYLDEEDWLWIAEFYLRHHMQITANQRTKLANTIKDAKSLLNRSTSYPDRWGEWLRWEHLRGEIASQCAANDESQLAKILLPQLISEVNKTYESDDLPFIHNYHEVIANRVEEKTANLKEEFRSELIRQIETRSAKFYRLIDVAEAARTVIDRYAFIAQKYENFKKIENTVHIQQEVLEVAPPPKTPVFAPASMRSRAKPASPKLDTEKRVWIEEQYQPKGIVSSLEQYTFHDAKQYGLILSRLGNSGMEELFQSTDYIYRTLTELGVFALILPHKYSFAVIQELEYKVSNSSRLHLRGLDGGISSEDEKPRLAIATSSRTLIHQEYEELLLFTTQEDTPLPLRSPLPRMALEPVHDILTAFGDPNEPFLDPFAFSGEVVVAAKSLGYRCDYLVQTPTQLDLVTRWCDRAEFPESLFKA
jgi:hypothetical protein